MSASALVFFNFYTQGSGSWGLGIFSWGNKEDKIRQPKIIGLFSLISRGLEDLVMTHLSMASIKSPS